MNIKKQLDSETLLNYVQGKDWHYENGKEIIDAYELSITYRGNVYLVKVATENVANDTNPIFDLQGTTDNDDYFDEFDEWMYDNWELVVDEIIAYIEGK